MSDAHKGYPQTDEEVKQC